MFATHRLLTICLFLIIPVTTFALTGSDPAGPRIPKSNIPLNHEQAPLEAAKQAFSKALADGDIGGDDIEIHARPWVNKVSVDIAENGDIYVAVSSGYGSGDRPRMEVRVFRSQDGGDSWQGWAELVDATY